MDKNEYMAMSLPYQTSVNVFENGVLFGVPAKLLSSDYRNEFEEKTHYTFKPILHPLSDLTKEIEHNGEKFIPIEEMCQYTGMSYRYDIDKKTFMQKDLYNHYTEISILKMPFIFIKKLIEWHFDIAGLIEIGEAVDYHTLPDFVF